LSEQSLPGIRLRHVGFVFQAFNLFPTLTAEENVEVALELKGIRGAHARRIARDLLDQVHLADRCRAYPADLSGGQKQRVALARALAGDPEILLADEPTAALDSHTGRSVLELMQRLSHEQNRAVVIVTHDIRVADIGDRLVHLEDGKIASVERLRHEPATVQPGSLPVSESQPQLSFARAL
jgi:putative ABC transport system ATP-binding protein